MENCCLNFLLICCISGVFVFIILGIFIILDNPFLIIQNRKKDDNDKYYYDKDVKKEAYLQYFFAAILDGIFAVLIYISIYFLKKKKKDIKSTIPVKEIEFTEKSDQTPINSAGTFDSVNTIINTNNKTETKQGQGMTEKEL